MNIEERLDLRTIHLPKGFMNCGIANNNSDTPIFVADTNDSQNWQDIHFPLPKGNWNIEKYSDDFRVVTIRDTSLRNKREKIIKRFNEGVLNQSDFSAEKDKTEKLNFTTLEKELTSEKQQGHLSTRHKKPAPMYLDEVLADIAEKELEYQPWLTPCRTLPKNPLKETEEIKKQISSIEGIKHNKGKLPLDTMITKQFPNALEAVCKATHYGHQKYSESDKFYDNFKKVEGGSQTYADALMRHNLHKNDIDEESGLPHIYLKCWNALAELEIWIEENKIK